MNFANRILSVLFAVSLSACGTTPMYDGPKRADNELALIKSDRTYVMKLDGRETPDWAGGNDAKFQVLPGQHTLLVALNDGTGYVRRTSREGRPVSFVALAGNSYVTVPVYGRHDTWKIEVVNEKTNRVVTLPPEDGRPGDDRLVGKWQGQRSPEGKCTFLAWKVTRASNGKFEIEFYSDRALSKLTGRETGRWQAHDGIMSMYSDGVPTPDVYSYTFIGGDSVRLTNVKRDPSADCMADYEFTDHRIVE